MAINTIKRSDKVKYNIDKLNEDIKQFPQVHPITADMKTTFDGVSRLVMLDRYAFKDTEKKTLGKGDLVVVTIKSDPQFPTRGIGIAFDVDENTNTVTVELLEEYHEAAGGRNITVPVERVDKPLEVYYEQIAKRVARGLSEVEAEEKQAQIFDEFYRELSTLNFVPAGRVLYGAGSDAGVTFFNCLAGETIVQTKEGSKEIKDLMGEVEVLSMDGEYKKAKFKSYGIQELYEVRLSNGEKIRATAGHEWFYNTKNGLKKANTLNIEGKNIPVVIKSKKFDEKEVQEGIKHGIVYGDGSLDG